METENIILEFKKPKEPPEIEVPRPDIEESKIPEPAVEEWCARAQINLDEDIYPQNLKLNKYK